MDEKNTLKDELIEQIETGNKLGQVRIDKYEAVIISVAIGGLTGGLISRTLSEVAYVGLIGTFFGYTFGRIFNHVQGKE
jgi:hypothetical protein